MRAAERRGPLMRVSSGIGVVAAVALVVVLGVGLLYAYRSQTPAMPAVSYTQALSEIQNGQVRSVVIEGQRATLTLADGTHQQLTVPDNGDGLRTAVTDRSRADPTRPIDLRYSAEPPGALMFVPVLVSLVPLLVLIALILLAASVVSRSRAPQRFEALARLGDLRDRGVLTEEEFQREKTRILK
jgi:ATP-dependent Zn protease